MWGVLRFYNLLRIGVTWKGPEVIELWYNQSDSSKGSAATTSTMQYYHHYGDDDDDEDGDDDDEESTVMDVTTALCASDDDTYGRSGSKHRPAIHLTQRLGHHLQRHSRHHPNNNNTTAIIFEEDNECPTGDDDDDGEKSAASGSDEDDSLLVAYDSNSVASVWQNLYNWEMVEYTIRLPHNKTMLMAGGIVILELYAQFVYFFWIDEHMKYTSNEYGQGYADGKIFLRNCIWN